MVAPSRDAVDEQVGAAVGADMPQRHRVEGLLLLLDDHDAPQFSSASRVTAGAFISRHKPSYSITSSALPIRGSGTVTPSAFVTC